VGEPSIRHFDTLGLLTDSNMSQENIDNLCVNTIKTLAMDAVEKAQSGHPGMPMGCADIGYILWTEFLNITPSSPQWQNRDRFVLSAGHGSMWQYALLHLSGFNLPMKEIENFRQLGSKTPGHPEYGHTEGVEATTGPLGQGSANVVGMALASKMMAAKFNTAEHKIIDHNVISLVSDGDLMEGISSEASSIAGHLKLSNLIYIYDDNKISIDGCTDLTFSEDVSKRYESYGWFVQKINGHNHEEIRSAMKKAIAESTRPSLIVATTQIACGSPNKAGKSSSHGAPLGADEITKTKANIQWNGTEHFHVPSSVTEHFRTKMAHVGTKQKEWEKTFTAWSKANPELSKTWNQMWNKEIPADLYDQLLKNLPAMPNATRVISNIIEQTVAKLVPGLAGGSADLASSCKTNIKDGGDVTSKNFNGRNIHFGIREHAMGAIVNGMALYGSWIPFGSTFLVFSDYMRPSIRVAALSNIQSLFIFTHDSIHVGEDGPTHQPVEQIPSLRLIPNLHVIRPADSMETAAAWTMAMTHKTGPTAMMLSRQNLDALNRDSSFDPKDILKGGYILKEGKNSNLDLILISTGSEVGVTVSAAQELEAAGKSVRVVSIPCLEIFKQQDKKYQESVLPKNINKAVIETAQGDLWYKWIGQDGLAIDMHSFGTSAPGEVVANHFGFSKELIVKKIKSHFSL
jgi:transketolase